MLGLLVALTAITPVAAQNVTQGYQSDEPLQNGMIVRLKSDSKVKVEALTTDTQRDMLGVTVANSDAPVSLSDPGQTQVFVATFGRYQVLVNTQNGPIKPGDLITISSIKGVGMKVDADHEVVIGKALESFADNSDAEGYVTLSDTSKTKVALGRIMVDIGVGRNPTYSGDTVSGVPKFLSRAAQAVTDRPVSALRLYACLAVLGVAFAIAGGIIYSGVRTGMTAVGRNPLAKKSIFRNLITVALMATIVAIVGIIAVYLLLRI